MGGGWGGGWIATSTALVVWCKGEWCLEDLSKQNKSKSHQLPAWGGGMDEEMGRRMDKEMGRRDG